MVEGLSGALVHCTLNPYVICVSLDELPLNATLTGVQNATRHAMYMYMNTWLSLHASAISSYTPNASQGQYLVDRKYIQRELGMALSTITSDSNKFVDKTRSIVKHLCPQIAKYTQFNQSAMQKLHDI